MPIGSTLAVTWNTSSLPHGYNGAGFIDLQQNNPFALVPLASDVSIPSGSHEVTIPSMPAVHNSSYAIVRKSLARSCLFKVNAKSHRPINSRLSNRRLLILVQ